VVQHARAGYRAVAAADGTVEAEESDLLRKLMRILGAAPPRDRA
jgi:tellurite resistance protein